MKKIAVMAFSHGYGSFSAAKSRLLLQGVHKIFGRAHRTAGGCAPASAGNFPSKSWESMDYQWLSMVDYQWWIHGNSWLLMVRKIMAI